MQAFYNTLLECGISFEEPEFVENRATMRGLDYEKKDFYHEKLNLPFPPHVNRLRRKLLSEAEKFIEKSKK
jgi:hypothetical protein